jgi:uncharacterized repeat protein (TIGR03803 family)
MALVFGAAQLHAQTLTTLHAFAGGTDGALAFDGVALDANGNIYGDTGYGGDPSCNSTFNPPGCGTVYKVTPSGDETILHAFTGVPDGQDPVTTPAVSGQDVFGTTSVGGVVCSSDSNGCGTVFELNQNGDKIAQYSFRGTPDASFPYAGVIVVNGVILGTGYFGGTYGQGAVFALKFGKTNVPPSDTVLHSFAGGSNDGAYPDAALVPASGSLFGTTIYGGPGSCNNGFAPGCGVVYKLTGTSEVVLHAFSGPDGSYPSTLIPDGSGGFYGITGQGGSTNDGTVYQITSSGTLKTLYTFTGGSSDGAGPGALVQDSAGNLLGTTYNGGPNNAGTIFELSPNGKSGWKESILYIFTGGTDGGYPQPGVAVGEQGTLFGSTSGGGNLNCLAPGGCGTVWMLTY